MYIGYRGHVTKCTPESVRLASSHEQLAAEDWAEALNEVLIKAQPAPPRRPEEQPMPVPPRAAAPPPPVQMDVAVGNQEPSAAADDPAEPAGSATPAGKPFLAFLRAEDQSRRRRTSMRSRKAEKTG